MFPKNLKLYEVLKNLIASYLLVVVSGLSTRIIAMISILVLSYYLNKEVFSEFTYIYNISMICAGMIFSPLITFYVRNSKELGFYFYSKINDILISFLCLLLIFLLSFSFENDSNANLMIFILFIVFYYIQQFITIHTSDIDKEILGVMINFLLMPLMWCLAYFLIKIDSIESFYLLFCLVITMLLARRLYNCVAAPKNKMSLSIETSVFAYQKLITVLKADFVPLLTTSVISGVGFLAYFFTVNNLFSPYSSEEKSIFNVVYQWFQIVIFFAVAINSKFLLNLRYSKNKIRDGCALAIGLCFIYLLTLLFFYIASGLYSIQDKNMLLHHGFVMLTTSLFSAISSILGVYLVYYGKASKGVYFNVTWIIVLFALFFVFLNYLTVSESSVYSLFFSYLLHLLLLSYYVRKIAK